MSNNAKQLDRIVGGHCEADFLNAFFVLYKNARILETNNPTFQKQSGNFFHLLKELLKNTDTIDLKIINGRYFVDGKMVKFDDKGLSGAASVTAEWADIGIGGVKFFREVSHENVDEFFKMMTGVRPNNTNLEKLSEQLKSSQISGLRILSAQASRDGDSLIEMHQQFRTAARKTFFRAMNVVEEIVVDTEHDRELNSSKTKRVVHSLIDHIVKDEASMVELTAIKNFDNYTYAHCTNVCIYSLTMGIRMGMDRPRLSQLGFSALFHDIGKVKLPEDLVKKPDSYDENDWIQMQRHPLLGAKTILRNLKLDSHSARASRGAFEHHISNDFKGYPVLRYGRRPVNLFSKIIAIADSFDVLTSGRSYLKDANSASDAFRKMHFQMKSKFDPFLLKMFTNVVGIYPSGSLVLLSTEEVALVLTGNDTDRARPYVKIIGNRDGLLDTPEWVDLSQGEYQDRKILRVIDPERHGLNVEDFILQD